MFSPNFIPSDYLRSLRFG